MTASKGSIPIDVEDITVNTPAIATCFSLPLSSILTAAKKKKKKFVYKSKTKKQKLSKVIKFNNKNENSSNKKIKFN